MNSLYDVYVKLFGASIIDESGYNKEENTIEYTNDNFKLIAYKSANGIMVDYQLYNTVNVFLGAFQPKAFSVNA